jgi:hypothetical protein
VAVLRAPGRAPGDHPEQRQPRAAAPRALSLVAWLGSLAAGVVLFHAMGSGPLEAPPLTDPSSWNAWADARAPLVAIVAVLRLVVLALAWYLVGVTTIGIVARLTRAARLARLADALTAPAVRRLLQGALGLGLATAMVGAATPAGSPRPPAATITGAEAGDEVQVRRPALARRDVGRADVDQVRLARTDGGRDGVRLARAQDGDRLRLAGAHHGDEMRLSRAREGDEAGVRAEGDRATGVPLPLDLIDRVAVAVPADGSDDRQPEDRSGDEVGMRRVVDDRAIPAARHEVEAGESFWTIARDVIEAASGQLPRDTVLHRYWEQLIEHNRGRLADPDNPDLLFPGQVLELPPTPADDEGRA